MVVVLYKPALDMKSEVDNQMGRVKYVLGN